MAEKQEFRQLVRLLSTDLKGEKDIFTALRSITGVSYSFANVICQMTEIDRRKKAGELSQEELKKIEDVIKNPDKYNVPHWLFNRRKDYESGLDKHIIVSDLKFEKDFDIKRLKKVKSYKGLRHQAGLPVRGQRTKAHFRHGSSIGVKKKAAKMAKKEKPAASVGGK